MDGRGGELGYFYTHALAPKSSTDFLLYPSVLQNCYIYKLSWAWAWVWMSQPRGVKPSLPYQDDPYLGFADFNTSGTFPMDVRTPPLKIKILLESNPPQSRILLRKLAVVVHHFAPPPFPSSRSWEGRGWGVPTCGGFRSLLPEMHASNPVRRDN